MNETRTIAFPFKAASREKDDGNICGSLSSMGKTIKKYRKAAGITQQELADQLGMNRNTVVFWETDRSRPSMDMLMQITHLLSIPITEIFDVKTTSPELSAAESQLIRHYRNINEGNQKVTLEMVRAMENEEAAQKAKMLEDDYHILATLPTSAAAGTGTTYMDNTDPLPKFYKKNSRYAKADFVCRVEGRSMEPFYPNGCLVYCRKSQDAPDGATVICDSNDGRLIKQKSGNVLISLNPDPKYACKKCPDDDVTIRGIVLGIVPDEDEAGKDIEPELQDVHFREIAEFRERNGIWDE